MQHNTGLIHGRFQVLHNDHLAYLLSGKSCCKKLIVGITNPDSSQTKPDDADIQRSQPTANPLTYYERYMLVHAALTEAGLTCDEFTIVPLPINCPELISNYAPADATYFLSIYDDWGRKKQQVLEGLGLNVVVLSERSMAEKGLSATEVRRRIITGESWRQLVPDAVFRLLTEWDITNRLQKLNQIASHDQS
jgi:nicotinamide mononucleotide adenylyltransferase